MVAHSCNSDKLEAEKGRLGVQGQSQLWIKVQASLGLIQPCFENNKNTDSKKKKIWWPVVYRKQHVAMKSLLLC